MEAVLKLQRRSTLTQAGLRVVKRFPGALVLTDKAGVRLQLWVEGNKFSPVGIIVDTKVYVYARTAGRGDI